MSGWSGLVPMEYVAPGPESFAYPPIFESVPWFDRYMLHGLVGFALVAVVGLSAGFSWGGSGLKKYR